MPQTPKLGRGYGAPPQTSPPRRSGASCLRASLGAFGPTSSLGRVKPPNIKVQHRLCALAFENGQEDRKTSGIGFHDEPLHLVKIS